MTRSRAEIHAELVPDVQRLIHLIDRRFIDADQFVDLPTLWWLQYRLARVVADMQKRDHVCIEQEHPQ